VPRSPSSTRATFSSLTRWQRWTPCSAAGDVDVAYSDHDVIHADGVRATPACKPDFSPEWLTAHNYIDCLVVLRPPRPRSHVYGVVQ
jgi:hypothetical protein